MFSRKWHFGCQRWFPDGPLDVWGVLVLTNFLKADLTKCHLKIYIFIVFFCLFFFMNRFSCGMFSCNILGCSFSHGWLSNSPGYIRPPPLLFFVHFCLFFFLPPSTLNTLKTDGNTFMSTQLVFSKPEEKWLRISFCNTANPIYFSIYCTTL